MIRFFRKIRLKLVRENKFGQYIKYAIGEIVLVVIGILIAVQINNWNQNRKDDQILNEYLVKIKSHTLEDLRKLDTVTVYRTQLADLCKKARTRVLDKTEDEDLILFMACGVAFADYYFKPSTGGYEALKNSRFFGKINNTALDSLLTRYHGLVNDIAENEKSYNDYVVFQEAHISTKFDRSLILASAFLPQDSLINRATPMSEYYEDFAEYTSSAPFRNVIGLAAFQFEAMVDQYDQLKDAGKAVIKEIDAITGE
ncbi:DUF6090 family protein [Draconibacterium orientale]|uniref:DUF6090 family protein n=1 Tax=Draconibacterium orientale TaxID=1168034 RepID=UPI002A0A42E5|nr:DUF6090 family protein [Draconibacterium orientale]